MQNQAFDVELPKLPRFPCSFAQPDDITAHITILMKVIKFVLTDVCRESQRHAYYRLTYEEHVEFTIDPNLSKRSATAKYHDGLGYDMNGYSRLIMERLNRNIAKKNIDYGQENTGKSWPSYIDVLNVFVRCRAAGSFSNLCTVLSLSLQCVCTIITLSTTKIDKKNIGDYIQTEVRHGVVPNTFNNCLSWMEVFKLVEYLFSPLPEHETII
ncbi:uncharacterized protein EV154DRAFT_481880 [Mucor mucedo]|uniref:uncharacterized protein n=1 Tax=Mucor mucedo TaxID=29922 RepID=UPI002220B154|nr:uncharacterized protein EV154DRAFT_481880 [Mucor mucedo]KAI7890752.1 hypothetical protein EV154DRAFT_481880 [Mucor mucedo]